MLPFRGLDTDFEILQDMDDKMIRKNHDSSQRSIKSGMLALSYNSEYNFEHL